MSTCLSYLFYTWMFKGCPHVCHTCFILECLKGVHMLVDRWYESVYRLKHNLFFYILVHKLVSALILFSKKYIFRLAYKHFVFQLYLLETLVHYISLETAWMLNIPKKLNNNKTCIHRTHHQANIYFYNEFRISWVPLEIVGLSFTFRLTWLKMYMIMIHIQI